MATKEKQAETVRRIYHIDRAASPPSDEGATFIASTPSSDRYGDIVDPSWILDSYESNPVIQVNHDYRVEATVGRAVSTKVEEGKLIVEVKWGSDAQSQLIAAKVKEGLLSAVSVGFRPGRSVLRSGLPTDHPYYADSKENPYGRVYYDNELLEVSVVAIPANVEALAQRSAEAARATLSNEEIAKIADAVMARIFSLSTLQSVETKSTPSQTKTEDTLAAWLAGGK